MLPSTIVIPRGYQHDAAARATVDLLRCGVKGPLGPPPRASAPAGVAVAGNTLHFAWVVPAVALAAVAGGILLARLRRRPGEAPSPVIAGTVYLTGALLLKAVSGVVLRHLGPREMYVAVTAAEELCEMFGASMLLATRVAVLALRPPALGGGAQEGEVASWRNR